jgi:dihydropyrimidinase
VHDVLVINGTVVTEEGVRDADVAVAGERIAAVESPGALGSEAARVIDAEGMLVLPGGVDPHVHYELEALGARSESADTSIGAMFGGNTTVIDFAFCVPPESAHDTIASRKATFEGRMAPDWGLHVILAGEIPFEVIEEIGDVVRGGIPTIKTMTTYGWMCDDGHRYGVMCAVAEAGGLSVIHAEDDEIARWLTKKYVREGKTHGAYIGETRPSLVEEAAIRRALLLAERSGSSLYILHMAAAAGVDALAEARARGLPCYGETLTPYLSFTADALWEEERGLLYNNYPTIKTQADQDILWDAIVDDRVQAVTSDHFLIKAADRMTKMGVTIEDLQCGQAGVEMRLPVLHTLGVVGGRLTLERLVQLTSTNPARLMGLYPKKGTIAPGSDADLVLFDPNRRWTVELEELHMDSDYNCWEGWELQGRPRTVLLRGEVVIEDGNVVGSRSDGRYLPRSMPAEVVRRPLDPALTAPRKSALSGAAT